MKMNFRLAEVASPLLVDMDKVELIARVELLEDRLKKMEQRLDLMIALKTNKLDLNKFTCDIRPLSSADS